MPFDVTAPTSRYQSIAHDFINSLSSVRSLVELLVDYPALDAGDRNRFISIIRDQAERLVHLETHLNPDHDTTTSL